ncbi:MAG: DNA polymerase IV [Sphingobacteriales bacterium]|nr:MAG: DNA polymerase IV [Sphingobacteriales bacterium]
MRNSIANSLEENTNAVIMYVDMNSFFASCEQQDFPELRGKPVGVITHDSPFSCIIAPSVEAKKMGVKTGMRLNEAKLLCPHIIAATTRPYRYRQFHMDIMGVLETYCEKDHIHAKSIDEAVMNLSSYKLVYPDVKELARNIKRDIIEKCGEIIKCSIGIAPNSFLAKLATELQKPDGLVQITPENLDGHLATLQLQDLPGIARNNARRLMMIGIKNPLEMRYTSEALLRKAFGGVVGNYWYSRLHFREVDLYRNTYRAMGATRTVSPKQRNKEALEGLLVSLLTRLEQRMVKQNVFCKEMSFYIRYKDNTGWDTKIRFTDFMQDAMEMRTYIYNEISRFQEQQNVGTMFRDNTTNLGIMVWNFVPDHYVQYSLFENRMQKDKVRKTMYALKDKYGRDIVRKASETISPHEMKDAIGFGSVKDLYEGNHFNQYLLEE